MTEFKLPFEKPLNDIVAKIEDIRSTSIRSGVDLKANIRKLELKLEQEKTNIYNNLTRWDRVLLARHSERPHLLDYVKFFVEDWVELHGDRSFADDKAMVCGFGKIDNKRVAIVGQQKGRSTRENLKCNFGMPNPEGYRKALRIMKLAEKFQLPVLTFIDTPGAYPGIGAEERGQAEAIARNLFEMSLLRTPVLNIVIGEGASGGALGIGVGDHLMAMENTWYSVISPEGCASILFRDSTRAQDAADAMQVAASDLKNLGIADEIIPEPAGAAHSDPEGAAKLLKKAILSNVRKLQKLEIDEVLKRRIERLENLGQWHET